MIIVTAKMTNRIANKNITPAGPSITHMTIPMAVEINIHKNA